VNLVLVPVVVRDGQGRAIGDLTKDDFQRFDRGKPQTIASFTVMQRGSASQAGHPSATAQASDRAAVYTTLGQTSLDFTDNKAKLAETVDQIRVRPIYQHAGRQRPDLSYFMAD
jgi:hypothetical protein